MGDVRGPVMGNSRRPNSELTQGYPLGITQEVLFLLIFIIFYAGSSPSEERLPIMVYKLYTQTTGGKVNMGNSSRIMLEV